MVTRTLAGRGQSDLPPPRTFDTLIDLIDMKFGTYIKLDLYFQLSETTWCLIGFHGNNSQINDVSGGPSWIFKFSDFVQICIFVLQNDEKTAFGN